MISVILPCYNSEEYLAECLYSLLAQTYEDLEILCIDDGSTDSTPAILDKFSHLDARISVFSQNNKGLSSARNVGLNNAKGEWVFFIDSDDTLPKQAIEILLNRAISCDGVFGEVKVIFEEQKEDLALQSDHIKLPFHGIKQLVSRDLLSIYPNVWAKLYRKEIIDKYKLRFPVGMRFEDVYWHWCYCLIAPRIYFEKQQVYNYRQHVDSIMNQTQARVPSAVSCVKDYIRVTDEVIEFYSQHEALNENKDALIKLIERNLLSALRFCAPIDKSLICYMTGNLLLKYKFETNFGTLLYDLEHGNLAKVYANCSSQELLVIAIFIANLLEVIFPRRSIRRRVLIRFAKVLRSFYERIL